MLTMTGMERNHDDSLLIDALGGTTSVAVLCEVEPQAVSQWRKNGIPQSRLMYLKLLRPDVFGAPATKAKKAA